LFDDLSSISSDNNFQKSFRGFFTEGPGSILRETSIYVPVFLLKGGHHSYIEMTAHDYHTDVTGLQSLSGSPPYHNLALSSV